MDLTSSSWMLTFRMIINSVVPIFIDSLLCITVQLYLRDRVAAVVRPIQQLIDYQKVELAPGERTTVRFRVTEKQLRFWNFACREVSEPGEFEISCGWADHLLETKRFTLD